MRAHAWSVFAAVKAAFGGEEAKGELMELLEQDESEERAPVGALQAI